MKKTINDVSYLTMAKKFGKPREHRKARSGEKSPSVTGNPLGRTNWRFRAISSEGGLGGVGPPSLAKLKSASMATELQGGPESRLPDTPDLLQAAIAISGKKERS